MPVSSELLQARHALIAIRSWRFRLHAHMA